MLRAFSFLLVVILFFFPTTSSGDSDAIEKEMTRLAGALIDASQNINAISLDLLMVYKSAIGSNEYHAIKAINGELSEAYLRVKCDVQVLELVLDLRETAIKKYAAKKHTAVGVSKDTLSNHLQFIRLQYAHVKNKEALQLIDRAKDEFKTLLRLYDQLHAFYANLK